MHTTHRLRIGIVVAAICLFSALSSRAADDKPVRLFILSGQSNMAGLNPSESFTPAIQAAFPDAQNIVVKSAQGGQPIRRWYKGWKDANGKVMPGNGDLYAKLLAAVNEAIAGKPAPVSITFVWMQGEADAKTNADAEQYRAALEGLIEQLRTDLGHRQIGFVIGRLSDWGNDDPKRPGWMLVRKTQVDLADASPMGAWVDTDDLNDKAGKNDLHYTREGYKTLGERFAEKSIELAKKPIAD